MVEKIKYFGLAKQNKLELIKKYDWLMKPTLGMGTTQKKVIIL